MMAKITCGGDFRGAVNYILDDRKRAEIIGSDGLRLRDKESIISSFTMQQERYGQVKPLRPAVFRDHVGNLRDRLPAGAERPAQRRALAGSSPHA